MLSVHVIDSFRIMVIHSLAGTSRSTLSETVPKWVVFETSRYACGRRIRLSNTTRLFAKVNVNKVNITCFTVSY